MFLGCRNIACAVCSSVAHSTMTCPQINPSLSPCPEPIKVKSSSYIPRSTTAANSDPERTKGSHALHLILGYSAATDSDAAIYTSVAFAAELMLTLFVQCTKLSTTVNISCLAIELAHHLDKEFSNYLLSGISHGLNPNVECVLSQNVICNNLQSTDADPYIVDDLIKNEVNSGFMIGPFNKPSSTCFVPAPLEWLQ